MYLPLSVQEGNSRIVGELGVPTTPRGIVVLTRAGRPPHPYEAALATRLYADQLASFSVDLLTSREERFLDAADHLPRLVSRLIACVDTVAGPEGTAGLPALPIGLFGSGTTTPATVRVAAQRDAKVNAAVCRGGLVDFAGRRYLESLTAPLLLLATPDDPAIAANRRAMDFVRAPHELRILGDDDDPIALAAGWFVGRLTGLTVS